MKLQLAKPELLKLKAHPEFSEKWLQGRIIEDTSLLGLGDLDLVKAEKPQPRAGRLDLLLHDDQLNRRYEVELMLGPTDPSHIMRCIEYWDIERRHYPAYDHVAVLVAEDITSRFLNVMSLLAGNIPLIAIQLSALRVEDKVLMHCVKVLDQTALRGDDEYENTGGSSGHSATDRSYWESRISPDALRVCDDLHRLVSDVSGESQTAVYRKRIIDIVPPGESKGRIWLLPMKTLVRVGGYVPEPEEWVKRFNDVGQVASLKRGNAATLVSFKPHEVQSQSHLLEDFVREALGVNEEAQSE